VNAVRLISSNIIRFLATETMVKKALDAYSLCV